MNLLYGQSNFAVNSGPTKINMMNVGKNRKAYKYSGSTGVTLMSFSVNWLSSTPLLLMICATPMTSPS